MAIDRDSWQVPAMPKPRSGKDADESAGSRRKVTGALGGSLLFDQPQHAQLKADILAFVAPGPPLAIEVGFDHGITLLANARTFPDWRWLGVEIRRKHVEAVRDNAPDNCLPLRLDARTLFSALLPDACVDRVDILFPTPVLKGHHMLVTDGFVADLRRVLKPGGVVFWMTDVQGLHNWMTTCFSGWDERKTPPRAPDLSRRERVCRRDGLPVWSACLSPKMQPNLL
ncbi:MAG: hypothetical protein KC502_23830 [Myxococcales bacterium]|nr:hypothetical protein [Myxococcales bacterium]